MTEPPSLETIEEESADYTPRNRGATADPLFGLLIAGAVAIGSMPLAPNDPDLRYTMVWGLLALFGVTAWLLGNFPRINQEKPENLAWGVALALVMGIPLLAFGSGLLRDLSGRIWQDFSLGTTLAYLLFIMPLAETLFFRGIMQELRAFGEVSFIATLWGLVLFFPHINAGPLPLIAVVVFGMANTLYSYVRLRNGMAAAWLCQIIVNVMIFFFPTYL
jgi:membrane protease YdiL (CAAX protease family)